ncbi:MAG TPA: metallophosphoesterase family protein [Casimicrobiaceae bacterium]|nr:metallophosphoesterase family protein [Casimicrobiaceae bacterium]
MKLNVLSDLHLGQGALDPPDNDADVVILAGDVSRPREAVAWARAIPKPVLYVAGNHEFYGDSIDGTLATLRASCAGTNIRFLDDDVAVLDGVRFVGSTLWTDFMLLGAARREEAMREGQRFLRDFSRIRASRDSDALYTPADSAARFDAHRRFVGAELAQPFAGPTVVITHHAPSPKSIHPRFRDSPLNPCFISDLEPMLDSASACLWVHGHTHDSFDYVVNGTRVVCNARGYAKDGVNENARFDPDLLVQVA